METMLSNKRPVGFDLKRLTVRDMVGPLFRNWGIVLVVWCSLAVAIIDNFVKPLLMRSGTGLPTMALFLGIAGGLEAYGPLGLFLGPAVMSVFAALLRVYQKTYIDRRREAA